MTATLCLLLALQRAEVVVLVEQLGDDRYPVRAEAQGKLELLITSEWGYLLLPDLEQARGHEDPEVVRRVNWVLAAYYTVGPSAYGAVPWLDMLPADYPGRQEVLDRYLRMARQGGYPYARDWPDYRSATWLYTQDLLRAGLSRRQVIGLLDDMAVRETEWLARRSGGR